MGQVFTTRNFSQSGKTPINAIKYLAVQKIFKTTFSRANPRSRANGSGSAQRQPDRTSLACSYIQAPAHKLVTCVAALSP
jgi:hypothetical protein